MTKDADVPQGAALMANYELPEAVAQMGIGERDALQRRMRFTRATEAGEALPAGRYDLFTASQLQAAYRAGVEAVEAFLEAQDALDNRELQGPNAEDYFVLLRRRNEARRELDAAISAAIRSEAAREKGDDNQQENDDGR